MKVDDGKSIPPERQDSAFSWRVPRPRKVPDEEVMSSIQSAVERTVSALDLEPQRDLLVQDFMTFESLTIQGGDSATDGCQNCGIEFKFLNYAPIAFKYFRKLFRIETKNFLRSMCSESLRRLENSGSSGSAFFLTHDDEYILKTAQPREGEFLLKLLPGYYLNLTQNPRTLLPKFFGFYCYSAAGKNLRILVMNNLIPSDIAIDQKYDLKGSTTKRKATPAELRKPFPTYKDLDFVEHHPDGLLLDPEAYAAFAKALQRDCRVLESFKIIDYSLLLAIHRVVDGDSLRTSEPSKGIPARTATGEELLLFVGIIDILQSYQFRKKIEHTLKSIIYEKDSISVHRPDFYSQRFQNFIIQTVFQPSPRRTARFGEPTESRACCSRSKSIPRIAHGSLSFSWTGSGSGKPAKAKPAISFLSEENIKLAGKRDLSVTEFLEKMDEESKRREKTKPEVIDRAKENDNEVKAANGSAFENKLKVI